MNREPLPSEQKNQADLSFPETTDSIWTNFHRKPYTPSPPPKPPLETINGEEDYHQIFIALFVASLFPIISILYHYFG